MNTADQLVEFKIFVDDTSRLTDRRQTVTNAYVTVNGAIISFITFVVASADLKNWWFSLAVLPIVWAGVMVCLYWRQLIHRYSELVRLRFEVLREMELHIPGSVKMYHHEDSLYPLAEDGKPVQRKGLNLSDLEARLPVLFITLYAVLGIGLIIATLLASSGVILQP